MDVREVVEEAFTSEAQRRHRNVGADERKVLVEVFDLAAVQKNADVRIRSGEPEEKIRRDLERLAKRFARLLIETWLDGALNAKDARAAKAILKSAAKLTCDIYPC